MLRNPVRLLSVVALLGVVVIGVLMWLLVLEPRLAQSSQLETETSQVNLANLRLVQQERQIIDLAKQAPDLAKQAQALYSRMPQTADLPAVLKQISESATSAGIRASDITLLNTGIPESVEAGTTAGETTAAAQSVGVRLATMTIEVTASGSQRELMDFLDNLQSLDRAVLITQTSTAQGPANAGAAAAQTLTVRGMMFVLESELPDLVANAQRVIDTALAQAGPASD